MSILDSLPGTEVGYITLLFLLIVVPRAALPLRIPAAVTAFGIGIAAALGAGIFIDDSTVRLLSTFGIVSLFLLAGLDVEFSELYKGRKMILVHLVQRMALYGGTAWVLAMTLDLPIRPALVASLALMTPSTGFILDSLDAFGLSESERFWVKSHAITSEVLALLVLFVVMQSESLTRLSTASGWLLAMLVALPALYWLFSRTIALWAPRSEFAFLLLVAVVSALGTKQLGVYYLVGAFVAGLVARMVRSKVPAMSSPPLMHAIELFASFFVPFYFFRAGTSLPREAFSIDALWLGIIFFVSALAVRVALTVASRRILLGEAMSESLRVAVPLLPTIVFTLVLAGILRESFNVSLPIIGGLIIYAVANTILPGFVIGRATPSVSVMEQRSEII
jgi:Kef-type K+ transport system membrane component KefB